jgi:hypothetical protein
LALAFALVEFSLLWSANAQVAAASQVACRVGTLPTSDPVARERAVREAALGALQTRNLAQASHLVFDPGVHTGDPVLVEIRVPMQAAAPDLLAIFGFELQGRQLVGRTVMRHE